MTSKKVGSPLLFLPFFLFFHIIFVCTHTHPWKRKTFQSEGNDCWCDDDGAPPLVFNNTEICRTLVYIRHPAISHGSISHQCRCLVCVCVCVWCSLVQSRSPFWVSLSQHLLWRRARQTHKVYSCDFFTPHECCKTSWRFFFCFEMSNIPPPSPHSGVIRPWNDDDSYENSNKRQESDGSISHSRKRKKTEFFFLPRNRVLYCTRHPAGGGGGVCGLVRDVFPTELCGSFFFRLPRTFGCSSSSCRCVSVLHYETCSTWLVFSFFSVFLIFADRKWAVRGPRIFLTFHSHWALGVCVCVYSILECPFFYFSKMKQNRQTHLRGIDNSREWVCLRIIHTFFSHPVPKEEVRRETITKRGSHPHTTILYLASDRIHRPHNTFVGWESKKIG